MLSTIIFSSLLAATAQAAAILPRADPIVWKNPSAKNGNIQVRFGDGRTSVGACTPEKIIKTLYDNCYDEGFCNSNSWTIQCQKDDLATHTITISTPEGQYQPWIKNGLVEALVAAVNTKDVVQTKTVTGQSDGGCVGCPWRSQSVKMHYMPSSIGISHLNDKQVPDVITLSIKSDSGGAAGVCEILTGAGGAMAGAFNGVAGGIFSLASLACKAI